MCYQFLVPNYMDYLQDFPMQIMQNMSFEKGHIMNIIAMCLCCTFGYLLYTVAGRVRKREDIDPYPVYLHCWMITMDSIGTITFWRLLAMYHTKEALLGGAWVFLFFSIGLPIWICMEARSIHHTIKSPTQRALNFGRLVKDGEELTENKARFWCYGTIAVSAFFNLYALSMLGGIANCAIFLAWPITNYVFALWTWRFWQTRAAELGTRKYQSMALHIVILIQISLMWIPGLSWYLALTPFLHTVWYYLGGIAMSALAAYNLYKCAKLPKRDETLENGKKPVW